MARKVKIIDRKIELSDDIELIFEKVINRFGTGAKIDAPKEYIGKKVYVIVRKK